MIYAVIPVALAVFCVFLGRRQFTALIIFAYLTMEGLLKLLSNYNRVVHIGLDIIVLSLAAWLIVEAVIRREAYLPHLPWARLTAAYAIWVVLQLLNPMSPGFIPSLAAFKVHLTMIPLYFIAASLFHDPRDIIRFLGGIVAITLVPYVLALVQYALGPASLLDLSPRFWQNISYYHEWRPFGTSAVPGGAAVFAYLVTPLAMVLLVQQYSKPAVRMLALLSIALAAGAFIVSGVRQVFLGCVLALVTMAFLMAARGRGRGAVALGSSLLIGAFAFVSVQAWLRPMATEAVANDRRSPEIWRQRDVTSRLFTLTQAGSYQEARANPIPGILYRAQRYPFGAGLGRTGSTAGAFESEYRKDARSAQLQNEVGWSDNFFADMIVETGLPGMLMLTAILIGMGVFALNLARRARDPTIAACAAALAGFYFSLLAMSWGSQPLLGNPITAYFWFLSGLLAAMARMEDEAELQDPEAAEAEFLPVPAGYR